MISYHVIKFSLSRIAVLVTNFPTFVNTLTFSFRFHAVSRRSKIILYGKNIEKWQSTTLTPTRRSELVLCIILLTILIICSYFCHKDVSTGSLSRWTTNKINQEKNQKKIRKKSIPHDGWVEVVGCIVETHINPLYSLLALLTWNQHLKSDSRSKDYFDFLKWTYLKFMVSK